jgi:hypothetical protein
MVEFLVNVDENEKREKCGLSCVNPPAITDDAVRNLGSRQRVKNHNPVANKSLAEFAKCLRFCFGEIVRVDRN